MTTKKIEVKIKVSLIILCLIERRIKQKSTSEATRERKISILSYFKSTS